jgi:hypothetical protein
MIIHVRGTHGSGKSTIVRAVMRHYPRRKALYVERRRIPIGYICRRKGAKPLFIPGSYENAFGGGCDTIREVQIMYKLIRKYVGRGMDVLYEGILAQHSTPNILRLHRLDGVRLRTVVLDIPLAKSIRGLKARRKINKAFKPFSSTNTELEARSILTSSRRLREAGVSVKFMKTRRQAREYIFDLLMLS